MAQLIGSNGVVLSVVPVSRRFYQPTTVLEANYLRVVCMAGPPKTPQSTTLTLFNWELADFASWLHRFGLDPATKPFDPHSEIFSFWGGRDGEWLRVFARLSTQCHELVVHAEEVARFADQLEGELQEFPIINVDDG